MRVQKVVCLLLIHNNVSLRRLNFSRLISTALKLIHVKASLYAPCDWLVTTPGCILPLALTELQEVKMCVCVCVLGTRTEVQASLRGGACGRGVVCVGGVVLLLPVMRSGCVAEKQEVSAAPAQPAPRLLPVNQLGRVSPGRRWRASLPPFPSTPAPSPGT